MKASDIIAVMDAWAPPALAYSWDKCGLATGDPAQRVTGVVTCLTVTREVLAAAKRAKAQMIVAHHPLIWDPLKSLRRDDPRAALAIDIAAAGIACYSAHTNLDVVMDGVNHVLARRIGLRNTKTLFGAPQAEQWKLVTFVPESHLTAVRDAVCAAGAGGIGKYTHCTFSAPGTGTFKPLAEANPFSGKKLEINEEAERRFETIFPKHRLPDVLAALRKTHPYEEIAYDLVKLQNDDPNVSLGLRGELAKPITLSTFAEQVRKQLGIAHVRVVGDAKRKVSTVAVMGGAGGSSAAEVPDGVDVFVTGDVKYHEALDATERGLALIDAGHHGTEKWIVPAMADHLKAKLRGLRATSYVEPDPFTAVMEKR
jgi:dinuclear metal center YbgI/SA1388 family protein